MKKRNYLLFLTVIGVISIVGCSSPQQKTENKEQMSMGNTTISSSKSSELKTNMRKLWEDHITWTRNVICCLVDGLPGADQALKRLLQNQDDIGNAIKPIYGEDAGKKLATLLHDHITISADVVNAAKAGDNTKLDDANKRWTANADEISTFLSQAIQTI